MALLVGLLGPKSAEIDRDLGAKMKIFGAYKPVGGGPPPVGGPLGGIKTGFCPS